MCVPYLNGTGKRFNFFPYISIFSIQHNHLDVNTGSGRRCGRERKNTYRYRYKSTSPNTRAAQRIAALEYVPTISLFSPFCHRTLSSTISIFIYFRTICYKIEQNIPKKSSAGCVGALFNCECECTFISRSHSHTLTLTHILDGKAASFHMSINRFPCYRCKYSINGYISHSQSPHNRPIACIRSIAFKHIVVILSL